MKCVSPSSSAAAQEQSQRMNLNAVKRHDRTVVRLCDTARHVVLYSFDNTLQSWRKVEVEGTLFVYERQAPGKSRFAFFILNRLSLDNFSGSFTRKMDVQITDSYLIYRTEEEDLIYGIWFYDKEERERIGALFDSLSQQAEEEIENPVKEVTSIMEQSTPYTSATASQTTPQWHSNNAANGNLNFVSQSISSLPPQVQHQQQPLLAPVQLFPAPAVTIPTAGIPAPHMYNTMLMAATATPAYLPTATPFSSAVHPQTIALHQLFMMQQMGNGLVPPVPVSTPQPATELQVSDEMAQKLASVSLQESKKETLATPTKRIHPFMPTAVLARQAASMTPSRPLTRVQFLTALQKKLTEDEQFGTQLYEIYLKSNAPS